MTESAYPAVIHRSWGRFNRRNCTMRCAPALRGTNLTTRRSRCRTWCTSAIEWSCRHRKLSSLSSIQIEVIYPWWNGKKTPSPIFLTSYYLEKVIDNSRSETLTFSIECDAMLHGFGGYFETVLYKDVMLSINPLTHSPGMFSWFPIFFPLQTPVNLKKVNILLPIPYPVAPL